MFSGEGCGLTEPISKQLCSVSTRELLECLESSLRSKIDGVETVSFDNVTDDEHVSEGAKDGRAIADGGLQIRLLIVATGFNGFRRLARHRLVNEICGDLVLNGRIHSLEIRALTPSESQKLGISASQTPPLRLPMAELRLANFLVGSLFALYGRAAGNNNTSAMASARSGKQESMNMCDCGMTSMHALPIAGA
jgi:stress-induced morphogen